MTATDVNMYAEKDDAYFGVPRKEIGRLLPDRTDRVLEIGCGSGETMKWLRGQRPIQYAVGIEIMPEVAERAESVFDVVMCGNIETMELPATSVDLIIALDVLEHLVDPWLVIRRLHTILNPGGAIVASIPNASHFSVAVPLAPRGRWNYTRDGLLDRTHLRFFTRQTAIDLLTCSGLVLDKLEYNFVGPRWTEDLSSTARWYSLKLLNWILPRHMFEYQFLIRVILRSTERQDDRFHER